MPDLTSEIISTDNQPKECIILAGGLGTRLRETVPDLPKCLAPVAGKPFLYHIIKQLQNQGINHFVFSLGYKHEHIIDFLRADFPKIHHDLSIEAEPLGTGGAIQKAVRFCSTDNIVVVNGDTFFNVSLQPVIDFHNVQEASCTLILKPMFDFDRYGVVEMNEKDRIVGFKEKKQYDSGLINGGIYVLNKAKFLSLNFPEKFSFEKDYLEKEIISSKLMGFIQDEYFIDIGIPEDFIRANTEISNYM